MTEIVKIELYKLFKQARTYYALLALFILEVIIMLVAYIQGNSILELLLSTLKQNFYFEGNLLNGNLILYVVLQSLWFNLPLILMIVISGMLTDEYRDKTLHTSLMQAIPKKHFILSKYLVAAIFTAGVVCFLWLTAISLSYLFFGKGELIVYLNSLNFFPPSEAFKRISFSFSSGLLSMLFYAFISLSIATFFKDATKTWIVAALFLVLTNILLKVDVGNEWFSLLFFPKLMDTWQYFFYYEINWTAIFSNSLSLIVHSLLFAGLGIYYFSKSDVV
ncbi:ABC transporter permease [Sediminitomix flava]|uniref:ABC-2 type transport system permease protein n=1 Tax=Sediminitomix flava TaxID=379075 RepID=A0A315ZB59_SEDFL|nr:ABC transporter permease [Sediminitomix flava]PWJ41954.1 ABC-2 type transport system permease protein [Sediminitomix flava]